MYLTLNRKSDWHSEVRGKGHSPWPPVTAPPATAPPATAPPVTAPGLDVPSGLGGGQTNNVPEDQGQCELGFL